MFIFLPFYNKKLFKKYNQKMKILNNNHNMKLQAYIYKSALCGSFLLTNASVVGEKLHFKELINTSGQLQLKQSNCAESVMELVKEGLMLFVG